MLSEENFSLGIFYRKQRFLAIGHVHYYVLKYIFPIKFNMQKPEASRLPYHNPCEAHTLLLEYANLAETKPEPKQSPLKKPRVIVFDNKDRMRNALNRFRKGERKEIVIFPTIEFLLAALDDANWRCNTSATTPDGDTYWMPPDVNPCAGYE